MKGSWGQQGPMQGPGAVRMLLDTCQTRGLCLRWPDAQSRGRGLEGPSTTVHAPMMQGPDLMRAPLCHCQRTLHLSFSLLKPGAASVVPTKWGTPGASRAPRKSPHIT